MQPASKANKTARWDGSCTAVSCPPNRGRQFNYRPNKRIFLALLVAVWLAGAPVAVVAGTEPVGRPALTLTLSRPTFGRCPERGRFDAPSCPLEERLFADLADGRLHKFSPLQAALVAGGIDDADCLARYQQKAAGLVDELRRSGRLSDQPRQRAEAIFQFMHQRVLYGGYDLAYTDLRRVLDDGRFNCVSATVLFNYLAGELGLDCCGLQMPGHAMSRVSLATAEKGDSPHLCEAPSGPLRQMGTVPFFLDVENTAPGWFSRNGNPPLQAVAAGQTIGAAAAVDRSKARPVSPIQMAAMIYYNRGVDLLGEKRYAEAAQVNAKAVRLDPQNATARGNLLATLNNWSIELGNQERFAEAVDLLRQGLAMDGRFEAFRQNFVHVHHQWVERLCAEGRYAEAIEILSRAAAEMPDRDYFPKTEAEVRQRWATDTVAATPANANPSVARP